MSIITAIIAAIVALAGFLIAKDVKISEFRHGWINDQRNDLATICAGLEVEGSCLTELEEALNRFELRENPDKPEWAEVFAAIQDLRAHVASGISSPTSRAAAAKVIKRLSRRLLKDEWDRVREGEPFYRWARWLIPAVLFAIAALVWWQQSYARGFVIVGCEVERLLGRTPAGCLSGKAT